MKKSIQSSAKNTSGRSEYEKYLESIIDTIRESLLILDPGHRVISANRTFYKLFRVKPQDTEKKLLYDLGNGQWNIPDLKKLLKDILPSHNPFNNFHVEHVFPRIGRKVMLLNARQIKEKGSWQNRILLAIEDITDYDRDKKEKEAGMKREIEISEELKLSENKLRTLTDNIPVLCWMANPEGWIYWFNNRWFEYTGKTLKESEGWGWQSLHDPEVLPEVLAAWKKSLKTGKPFEMIFPLRGADSKFRPFLTRIVPIRDEGGKIIQWFGTNTDVYNQQQGEIAQKRLAAIIESSDDSIVSKNLKGVVNSWNKGAEKIFGYKAEEIVGKSIRTIIPQELQSQEDYILSQIRQGKRIVHFQTERLRKDGKRINVPLTVSPIKNSEGKIIGASKIARDISEEIQLQKQKDNFLAIASHELKTPVTSIKAYGQVLQTIFTRKGDRQGVDLLKKMETQIDRLTNLIGDLLDVTKIQTGKLEYKEGFFDFNDLVNEIIDEVQLTTEKHKIKRKLADTCMVLGDRERIGQVLSNLITNAIKYSPRTKEIIVFTEKSAGKIQLCVQDFGIGIPREKQSRIFQQFYRVSGPDGNSFPGLGLGLYISSEIIKRQKGKIWVNSSEGRGSTFCFSLPVHGT